MSEVEKTRATAMAMIGSKPSPITPAQSQVIAQQKAHEHITLEDYITRCRAAGAVEINIRLDEHVILVSLPETGSSRITTMKIQPNTPVHLWCMLALEKFKEGIAEKHPAQAAQVTVEHSVNWTCPICHVTQSKALSRTEDFYAPWQCDHCNSNVSLAPATREMLIQQFAAARPPEPPVSVEDPVNEEGSEPPPIHPDFELKTVAPGVQTLVDRPPLLNAGGQTSLGVGKRKPLSLPMCKNCKEQPIAYLGGEFCGSECAQAWFKKSMTKKR